MHSTSKAINSIFKSLSPRQREVISCRFGLVGAREGLTLAAVGDKLNVTRERVRQIEKSALGILAEEINKEPACLQILNRGKKFLKDCGGVATKTALFENIGEITHDLQENQLNLLIEASRGFHFHPEDNDFRPFYYLDKGALKNAINFIDKWAGFLESHKSDVLSGSYETKLASFVKTNQILKGVAENFLSISKKIYTGPYGNVGLRDWPEIRPATARDRAYLVVKKHNKPMHFAEIAQAINSDKLAGKQRALAATVHNELIKDERFVLVGRGIYGLREQGYEPGIARVVIQKLLKREGPLPTNAVIDHVQKQRFFRPNTILINLQNKNFFERLEDGRYRVRES